MILTCVCGTKYEPRCDWSAKQYTVPALNCFVLYTKVKTGNCPTCRRMPIRVEKKIKW